MEMTSLIPPRKKRAHRLQQSEATILITKKLPRKFSSDEESAAGEQPAAEIQEAYWRDSASTGCKCRECNHFERMLKSDVIELMTSVQGPPKCELQSHVLGILSVYVMTSAASTTQQRSTYKVLGTVVCEAVFMGTYAVDLKLCDEITTSAC